MQALASKRGLSAEMNVWWLLLFWNGVHTGTRGLRGSKAGRKSKQAVVAVQEDVSQNRVQRSGWVGRRAVARSRCEHEQLGSWHGTLLQSGVNSPPIAAGGASRQRDKRKYGSIRGNQCPASSFSR